VVSASTSGAQFQATPLSIRDSFARARQRVAQAWIMTSATLTVASRFDAFLGEIGLSATTRRWDSPFELRGAGPAVSARSAAVAEFGHFAEDVADAAWPVICASGGRAFVLCAT